MKNRKPSQVRSKRMDACARGQLLILAPWEHHNERTTISRNQCLSLNDMARILCESLDLPSYRCNDDAGER